MDTIELIKQRIDFYERQAQQANAAHGALVELLQAMTKEKPAIEEVIHDSGTNDNPE